MNSLTALGDPGYKLQYINKAVETKFKHTISWFPPTASSDSSSDKLQCIIKIPMQRTVCYTNHFKSQSVRAEYMVFTQTYTRDICNTGIIKERVSTFSLCKLMRQKFGEQRIIRESRVKTVKQTPQKGNFTVAY